jgi:hypothetical protein
LQNKALAKIGACPDLQALSVKLPRAKATGDDAAAASWLNQVEVWFSILTRQALRGASFRRIKELSDAIAAFIAAYNKTAAPFTWKKTERHPKILRQ